MTIVASPLGERLFNTASLLTEAAKRNRSATAIIDTTVSERSDRRTITFGQLEDMVESLAQRLAVSGITQKMRTLLMVRPGIDFVAIMFALFKIGAVPVLIDPGMGIRRLLECIRHVQPEGFIGISLAHAVRIVRPNAFRSVRVAVTIGRRWFWGGPALKQSRDRKGAERAMAPSMRETSASDTAAILFTSGSTGPAKGVVYEHGMFEAQIQSIQAQFGMEPGEVDLIGFPPFALFSVAMGMTVVFPRMDFSQPAKVDPRNIVDAVAKYLPTNSFGSPALWQRVADYCTTRCIKLPSLRRVLIFGAPVSWRLVEALRRVLPEQADVHTPFGATESLPVTSIGGRTILDLRETSEPGAQATGSGPLDRRGTCVGFPLAGMNVRVIRITEEPIPVWSDDSELPVGEVGEIVVTGPVVTKEYFGLPEATAHAKIRDGERIWHRMGDVGYFDDDGRLWFCGRKAHRVITARGTLFSVPCEAVFNDHPDVFRSALVGTGPPGAQVPVIVVEPGRFPNGRRRVLWRQELRELALGDPMTAEIEHFLFRRRFPVDVRHNAKINRERLAGWAARRTKVLRRPAGA